MEPSQNAKNLVLLPTPHLEYPPHPCLTVNSLLVSKTCWRTWSQFRTVTSAQPVTPSLSLLKRLWNMGTKPLQSTVGWKSFLGPGKIQGDLFCSCFPQKLFPSGCTDQHLDRQPWLTPDPMGLTTPIAATNLEINCDATVEEWENM